VRRPLLQLFRLIDFQYRDIIDNPEGQPTGMTFEPFGFFEIFQVPVTLGAGEFLYEFIR
jgi:hypothetical protein